MPELPPQDDPVVSRPMSVLILVSVFLLLLTVAWSLYGEFFGLRPWRDYQAHFRDLYSSYLRKQISQRRTQEQAFYASADYKKLKAAVFGTGFMGRVHTEGIRRLGNVEVAAIAASSDEKARLNSAA